MSYKISSKLVYFAALALSASAYANLVVTGSPAAWQANGGPTANPNSLPTAAFWDQFSRDGSKCNVGYWLQETTDWATVAAGCNNGVAGTNFAASGAGPGNLAFLSGAAGQNTSIGWQFKAPTDNTNSISLKLEIATGSPTNIFGYTLNGVDTMLYAGVNSPTNNPNKVLSLTAGDTLSFYLCPGGLDGCAANRILRSQWDPTANVGDRGGKFALFSEVPTAPTLTSRIQKYWVGVEDKAGSEADGAGFERRGDYNDFVISATVVPEPGFYGALSLGLGGLFMLVRRRRQAE